MMSPVKKGRYVNNGMNAVHQVHQIPTDVGNAMQHYRISSKIILQDKDVTGTRENTMTENKFLGFFVDSRAEV